MFKIDGKKIYLTRGDRVTIKLTPRTSFTIGDVIRFTVVERGKYKDVLIDKSVVINNINEAYITLSENETKIFKNEIKVYNYEISYNGIQTPIGYDTDGEKILTVYPEVEVSE